ncbi:hypothetical protein CFP71_13360 [Amycolatopsis thailandensis]|uniref:Uncharacterized protein n=1 Tax=Amycolatopsis thailandensis TaxID=589330 RepID=A0A229SCB2_9PSEU|nr:hypothetical protein [Amycolatopsis thailandensis]OXM56411.1 hypothetical protein CFP71_13360 [Amycolatopsis thailandensis]
MPKPSTPLPYGAHCYYEVSEEADDRYGVIRFYRYRRDTGDSAVTDTYRVTIERTLRTDRSSAHVDVQNPDERWTRIVSKDASKWHSTTSPHSSKGTDTHPDPGIVTLKRLADTLAAEAIASRG